MKYYKLIDRFNDGAIVRTNGRIHHLYRDGKWIETGMLVKYFNDESEYYNLYEEISENEALEAIRSR